MPGKPTVDGIDNSYDAQQLASIEQAIIESETYNIMSIENPELYNDGALLPPGDDQDSPNSLRMAKRGADGQVVVNTGTTGSVYVAYTIQEMGLQPVPNEDSDIIEDLIDSEWDYFVEDEEDDPVEEEIDPADIVDDVFMSLGAVTLLDVHAEYLTKGPQLLSPNNQQASEYDPSNVFCVFYIKNGKAYPIPNYQTLEVMLVERRLNYDSIETATDEDYINFDFQFDGVYAELMMGEEGDEVEFTNRVSPLQEFTNRKLASRHTEWNRQVRFDSGYRPYAPYVRDPGDYYSPSEGTTLPITDPDTGDVTDIFFPFEPRVFQGQTAKEKMRETFEGKAMILNIKRNDEDEVDTETIENFDNTTRVRILTYGYWKAVFDPNVMRDYNINESIGAEIKHSANKVQELLNAVAGLDKKNGITVLQDDGGGDPIWNSFPHIKAVNFLDREEYKTYYQNTNSGNPFEKDFLLPYEPPGSVKYYTQASTRVMEEQLIEDLESLADQREAQEEFNAAIDTVTEQLDTVISDMETRLASISSGNPVLEELGPKIDELKNDLLKMFDNAPGSDHDWKVKKKKKTKEKSKNLLKAIRGKSRRFERFCRESWREYAKTHIPVLDSVGCLYDTGDGAYDDDKRGYLRGGGNSSKSGISGQYNDGRKRLYASISNAREESWKEGDTEGYQYCYNNNCKTYGSKPRPFDEMITMIVEGKSELGKTIEEIEQDLINKIAEVKTNRTNWLEIPNREGAAVDEETGMIIPGYQYTMEDLANYQRVVHETQEFISTLDMNYPSIESATVALENFSVAMIGEAYFYITYLRRGAAKYSPSMGRQKHWIRWPSGAANLVTKYIPFVIGDTYTKRYKCWGPKRGSSGTGATYGWNYTSKTAMESHKNATWKALKNWILEINNGTWPETVYWSRLNDY